MIRLGLDPGQTGAIAAIDDHDNVIILRDMPTMPRLHGKGEMINGAELASIIMDARAGNESIAYLEQVAAMPGQGVTSMFHFGESVGIILGVLQALQCRYVMVRPQQWKKAAGIAGKDKDAARTMAIQLFPSISDKLTRKKDIGRADALLIAKYGK
jgi:crossover junction endodeoxyribonuclease RuvC